MEKGILYIVATPIGNLKDITLRSIEILGSVDAIAAEDTRKTGLLLKHISETVSGFTNKPLLLSFHDHNEYERIPGMLNLLVNGKNVALVSDAGTPTVSDPGFKLVRECIKQGIKVESIPGPSSVISSLVSSGLPTDKFLFVGYPPKKAGNRNKLFLDIKNMLEGSNAMHPTIIFFEAPHRIIETLQELKDLFGDIEVVVMRELTKIHEEHRIGLLSEHIEHFIKKSPKGEFVLLFNLDK